jgi:hypothetical protein
MDIGDLLVTEKLHNARVYKKENIIKKMVEEGVKGSSAGNSVQGKVGYENFEEEPVNQNPPLKKQPSQFVNKRTNTNNNFNNPRVPKSYFSRTSKSDEELNLQNQNRVFEQPTGGKVKYRYAGKESIIQAIKKALPKEFFPTKRMEVILGYIFLAVVILSIFRFPLLSLMRGDEIAVIGIGFPFFNFFVFDLVNPKNFPLRIWGLIFDIIIFLIIAYIIDVIINFVHYRAKSLTKEERGKRPKVLKVKDKKTIAEKITDKIFDE